MIHWIGADPGTSGAIAVIDDDLVAEVYDLPYHQAYGKHRYVDEFVIYRLVNGTPETPPLLPPPEDVTKVLVEKPGEWTPNSAAAMQLGHCFGVLCCAFSLYDRSIVAPKVWQRHWLRGSGEPGWSKEYALELAREFFPDMRGELERKKDDGRAEALLIALYAKER